MAIFSVWFSSVRCIYIVVNQTSRTFSSSRRESLSGSQRLPAPPHQALAARVLFSLPVGLSALDIQHKGNHTIFVSWWTSLTEHKIRVHAYWGMCQTLLFKAVWLVFPEGFSDNLSSVNRCLCCFYLLAIVLDATENMSVQIFLWDPAFSSPGYTLRNAIAAQLVVLLMTF